MGPKITKRALERSVSPLLDICIPKTENMAVVKTEEKINDIVKAARYVHSNPYTFKGRLGYA